MMGNLYILDHPLIQHKLTYIRDKTTGTKQFRELVDELSMLMGFEITRNLPVRDVEVETPIKTAKAQQLTGKKIGLIPILRAGLGMVDGIDRKSTRLNSIHVASSYAVFYLKKKN